MLMFCIFLHLQVLSLSAGHALMALLADAGRCLALSVRMARPSEDEDGAASPFESPPPRAKSRTLPDISMLPDLTERALVKANNKGVRGSVRGSVNFDQTMTDHCLEAAVLLKTTKYAAGPQKTQRSFSRSIALPLVRYHAFLQ